MKIPLRLVCALSIALLLALPGPRADAAPADFPGVFGARAVALGGVSAFKKWTDVQGRHAIERSLFDKGCTPRPASYTHCTIPAWEEFLDKLKGASAQKKLNAVQLEMNRVDYVQDVVNWGVTDYWATPREFLTLNGDCEDFAIAKFYSLLRLGFRNEDMSIVVLTDQNLRVPHAVLVVRSEGQLYVLDNQITGVAPATAIRHYNPHYAVNLDKAWRYVGAKRR